MESNAPGPAKGYQKQIKKDAAPPPPKKHNTDYSSPAAKKWPLFITALESNNVEDVKRMIEEGINVNLARDGITPLMVAASKGYTEVADVILQAGVNINAKNDDGWNALHKAAFDQAGTGVIDLLLQSGVDLEAKTNAKKTALQLAEEAKHREIVRVIKKHHLDIQHAAQAHEAFLNSPAGKSLRQQKLLETLTAYSRLAWLPPVALGIGGLIIGFVSGAVIRSGLIGIIAGLLVDLSVFLVHNRISADLNRPASSSDPDRDAVPGDDNAQLHSPPADLPDLRQPEEAPEPEHDIQKDDGIKMSPSTMNPKLFTALVSLLVFLLLAASLFMYRAPLVKWFYAKKVERSGIPFSEQAFLAEVTKNNEETVDLFLKAGIPVDVKNEKGQTAIALAAEKEAMSLLDKIAALSPALINEPDGSGNTPLMIASRQGRERIVTALVERGAAVNHTVSTNEGAATALQAAIDSDVTDTHVHIIQYLVQHGADVKGSNKTGKFPLLFAAEHGRVDVATLLIEKGAEVNAADQQGVSALHAASCRGHAAFVEMLVTSGANVNRALPDGQTPLMCAVRGGHGEAVRMLLEKGAPVAAKTGSGATALTEATRTGDGDIAALLLAQGADPASGSLPDAFTSLNGTVLAGPAKKAKAADLLKRITAAASKDGYTISGNAITLGKVPANPKGSWNKVLAELAATNHLLLMVKDTTVMLLPFDPAGVKHAALATTPTASSPQ